MLLQAALSWCVQKYNLEGGSRPIFIAKQPIINQNPNLFSIEC